MKKLISRALGIWLNTLAYVAPNLCKKKGFELFCNPFPKKLKPFHIDFLKTSEQFEFFYDDKKIQGYKWGNGPKKVLLLHGWASNSFRWKKLIEELSQEDVTIYAFDAPGHGMSEGKMMNVLIYNSCLMAFFNQITLVDYLVSHSIGGLCALFTFHKEPQLKDIKTVILAAPGELSDFLFLYKNTLKLNNKAFRLIIEQIKDYSGKTPEYFSSKNFAQNIENKILLIHDKFDKDTACKYSIELSNILKNNELIITEGLGHNLKSDMVNSKIIEFVVNA